MQQLQAMTNDTLHRSKDTIFDALREYVGRWYETAYGSREPYQSMIEFYASGTERRTRILLGPLYDRLMQEPPRHVLDVGAGYASIPVYLAAHWPDTQFLITDIRDDYFACGRQAAEKLGLKSLQFAVSDVTAIDTTARYDLVTSCNMLNFMNSKKKLKQALTTLAGVVAPGGHLIVYTPHFWSIFEPFTRIPFLHWLPHRIQDMVVRRTGKRQRLSDARNPSLREIRTILEAQGLTCIGVEPASPWRRLRLTHLTTWFVKNA